MPHFCGICYFGKGIFMSDNAVITDEEMDALMEGADLEASADRAAVDMVEEYEQGDDGPMHEEEAMAEAEGLAKGEKDPWYMCPLTMEYEWDGDKVSSLDLSGLMDLRTVDLEFVDMVLAKMGHSPQDKYRDTTFQKHVAMKATGYPVEFFNMLSIRDMMIVGSKVFAYFLFGSERMMASRSI